MRNGRPVTPCVHTLGITVWTTRRSHCGAGRGQLQARPRSSVDNGGRPTRQRGASPGTARCPELSSTSSGDDATHPDLRRHGLSPASTPPTTTTAVSTSEVRTEPYPVPSCGQSRPRAASARRSRLAPGPARQWRVPLEIAVALARRRIPVADRRAAAVPLIICAAAPSTTGVVATVPDVRSGANRRRDRKTGDNTTRSLPRTRRRPVFRGAVCRSVGAPWKHDRCADRTRPRDHSVAMRRDLT